jgi:hypothetical protein
MTEQSPNFREPQFPMQRLLMKVCTSNFHGDELEKEVETLTISVSGPYSARFYLWEYMKLVLTVKISNMDHLK